MAKKYELPIWSEPTYDEKDLKRQAGDAINPEFDAQISGLERLRGTATNQFNTTKENLIDTYAKRVLGIETDTIHGKNTYSNNINSRGFGRSSIALGGLEDIGIRGAKRVDETNTERDRYIGQAQGQYDTLMQNYAQEEKTINTSRASAIRSYIDGLKDKIFEKSWKEYQAETQRIDSLIAQQERDRAWEQQLKQAELDEAFRQEQLKIQQKQLELQKQQRAVQRAAASKKSSSGSKNKVANVTISDVRRVINNIAGDSSVSTMQKMKIVNQFINDNPNIKKDKAMMNYIGSFKDELSKY